jgi:hypothetical protein
MEDSTSQTNHPDSLPWWMIITIFIFATFFCILWGSIS